MSLTNKESKVSCGQLEAKKKSLAGKTESKSPEDRYGKEVRGPAIEIPPATLHGGLLVPCDC